jgi:hypothetical protein
MTDDNIIDPPEDGPRPPIPLPDAAHHAVRLLRLSLGNLKKRTWRAHAEVMLGHVIEELECGLRHEAERAAGDFSRDLFRALRPDITFGEIQGARVVLELIVTALPTYPEEARS